VEVVASLFQGRTAAAQCGLFTHKSVPVIFEPPCKYSKIVTKYILKELGLITVSQYAMSSLICLTTPNQLDLKPSSE